MTLREQVVAKVLSGKWLLTVTGGLCLTVITVIDCVLALQGKKVFVDPSALLTIVTGIVMSYFGRPADPTQPTPAPADPNADTDVLMKKLQERLSQPH